MSNEERLKLLKKSVAGDVMAQEELVQEYLDFVNRHLQHASHTSADSVSLDLEGVGNETLKQAFQGLTNGEFKLSANPEECMAAFEGWLRRIATNRLIDARRAAEADKRGGGRQQITSTEDVLLSSSQDVLDYLALDELTASRIVAQKEAKQALEEAFEFLKQVSEETGNQYYAAFSLHFVEGLSIQATATSLGLSEGQVRHLLRTAKNRLQEHIGSLSLYLSRKG